MLVVNVLIQVDLQRRKRQTPMLRCDAVTTCKEVTRVFAVKEVVTVGLGTVNEQCKRCSD
jgi:hypothetical protein